MKDFFEKNWVVLVVSTSITILFIFVSMFSIRISISSVENGYMSADSTIEKNFTKKISEVNSSLTKKIENSGSDKLTYMEAYGLIVGESKKDIPSFTQMVELTIIDSTGAVDTTNSYTELVPPVLNWRYWKGMKHVPTEVFASDTTKNGKVIIIHQYFQPTFSTVSNVSKKSDVKVEAKKDSKDTPVDKKQQPASKSTNKIVF